MSLTPQIDQDVAAHDWSAARAHTINLIHDQPGNAKAYYFLAQIDARMGNAVDARNALATANTIDPSRSFVGNFTAYNNLSGYLNPYQQVATVHTASATYAAASSKTPTWAWFAGGAAISMLIVFIIVMVRNAMQRNEERLRDERTRERADILESERIRARAYARDSVRETGFVHDRSTEATERPLSRYYSPSPSSAPPAPQQTVVHTGGGSGDMLTGILVGEMLADRDGNREVLQEHRYYQPDPSPSPVFDTGGGFDMGSSSGGGDFGGFDSSGGSSDF